MKQVWRGEKGSRDGCLVVVPASYGGAGICGGVIPVVAAVKGERKKEKQRESGRNREEADFFAYFGTEFFLPQAIKSTSIYRRWKRAIVSTLEKNYSP